MTYKMIQANDQGEFKAYIAVPDKLPAPVIVVIQEIFGVNEGIRKKCDWMASEGFIAIAPDLFWRLEPSVELTDKTEEEWNKAFDLMSRFDVDKGVEDLKACAAYGNALSDSTGKAGCIGYCLGGKLDYLFGCRSGIEASVGYYGVGINELLADANKLQGNIMLHVAEEDEFVSKDAQQEIKDGLSDNPKIEIHSYPGMNHAFTREGGKHYDAEAAKLADSRTVDFLKFHLGLKQERAA